MFNLNYGGGLFTKKPSCFSNIQLAPKNNYQDFFGSTGVHSTQAHAPSSSKAWKQGLPQRSSGPRCLTAGRHASAHARNLTSQHPSSFRFSSLIQSQKCDRKRSNCRHPFFSLLYFTFGTYFFAESHSWKLCCSRPDFSLEENWRTKRSGSDSGILPEPVLWIIIRVIHFPTSDTILICDSSPTLWPRSREVTNVSPWKQTCHGIVTAGLQNEIQLCRRGTSWWPDWSHISTTLGLLTAKLLWHELSLSLLETLSPHLFVSQAFLSLFFLFLSSFISISVPPVACRLQRPCTSQFDDTGQLKGSCFKVRVSHIP